MSASVSGINPLLLAYQIVNAFLIAQAPHHPFSLGIVLGVFSCVTPLYAGRGWNPSNGPAIFSAIASS